MVVPLEPVRPLVRLMAEAVCIGNRYSALGDSSVRKEMQPTAMQGRLKQPPWDKDHVVGASQNRLALLGLRVEQLADVDH